MDDAEFDRALVARRIRPRRRARLVACQRGRRRRAAPACRWIARARRFPVRGVILLRFGSLADQAALAEDRADGTARDRLFDLLMRRIDVLQAHRAGVLALLRWLPADPCAAALLAAANLRCMRWMLEARGHRRPRGPRGQLRRKGLLAVWLWTVRAWRATTARIWRRPWRRSTARWPGPNGWPAGSPAAAPPRPRPPRTRRHRRRRKLPRRRPLAKRLRRRRADRAAVTAVGLFAGSRAPTPATAQGQEERSCRSARSTTRLLRR